MLDRLKVLPQYIIPQQALTALAGRIASAQAGRWSTWLIRWFVRRYQVNLAEAAQPDLSRYASFNDFFTRALATSARPAAQAALLCPVDGRISQLGRIVAGQLLQAKGHWFDSAALLGGDAHLAAQFEDGSYATLYLSPRDYHRVHMPLTGRLKRMVYVPGALFSVNPATARTVPGLFARNERVVCVFESAHGPFVLVLVGAAIVGGIATVWHGVVNAERQGVLREWHYAQAAVQLHQGEEMGRFLLGSTVVALFPPHTPAFHPAWLPGRVVRLREAMSAAESGAEKTRDA
jgi:phosphatidylserine decarboxylase